MIVFELSNLLLDNACNIKDIESWLLVLYTPQLRLKHSGILQISGHHTLILGLQMDLYEV